MSVTLFRKAQGKWGTRIFGVLAVLVVGSMVLMYVAPFFGN
jgi:hypothetical protein